MNELIPVGPVSPLRQRLIDDMTMRRFRARRSATICATSDGSRRGWGARPTPRRRRISVGSRSSSKTPGFRCRR